MKPPTLSVITLSLALLGAAAANGQTAQILGSPRDSERLNAVVVTLDTHNPGPEIPADYSGLSFEISQVLPGKNGKYYFDPQNKALIGLFQTLGIKSLRVGGNTADKPSVGIPTEADIDSLYAFAKAADARVIYTVRLKNSEPQADARIGNYIWEHYGPQTACLAIGNEPNFYYPKYSSYADDWRRFAGIITEYAPSLRFCGPCLSPSDWLRGFMADFGHSGHVTLIAAHAYFGGAGDRVREPTPLPAEPGQADQKNVKTITPLEARDKILSAQFLDNYDRAYRGFAQEAVSKGLPYRFEETNNFYNGGAKGVSDTFAAALWGLDYLHWWAAHRASGINFHTGDNVAAGQSITTCKYAAYVSTPDGYTVHPLGYGMKAFDLGSHGRIVPLTVSNVSNVNLTAYGVLADDGTLYVTIINKEHGNKAADADVTLVPGEGFGSGQLMFLEAPQRDVAATSGETLGGAPIQSDGSWDGTWETPPGLRNSRFEVKVPCASAVVVKLSAR